MDAPRKVNFIIVGTDTYGDEDITYGKTYPGTIESFYGSTSFSFVDDMGDDRTWDLDLFDYIEEIPAPDVQVGGGATDYYDFPEGATTLNDLIEYKNMSFALGNIFKACYRLGEKADTSKLYDINKIIYFAERMKRIEEKKTNA